MTQRYLSKRERINERVKKIILSEVESFDYNILKGELMVHFAVSEGIVESILKAFVLNGDLRIDIGNNQVINLRAKENKKKNIDSEIKSVFGEEDSLKAKKDDEPN